MIAKKGITGSLLKKNLIVLTQNNQTMPPALNPITPFPQPHNISYSRAISGISKELKLLGVDAHLYFNNSAKNFLMAQKTKQCLLEIKNKGIKIPKFSLNLNRFEIEYFEVNTAMLTDIMKPRKINPNTSITIIVNSPKYKYVDKQNNLFRKKCCKGDSLYELDFFHEFAHVYQARFDMKNYNKLLEEKIPDDAIEEAIQKISNYATGSKAEFVAEYFSYRMMGKEIKSEKLAKLYEECQGLKID